MVDTNMRGWVPGIEQPSWSWKNEMLLYDMVIVDQIDQRSFNPPRHNFRIDHVNLCLQWDR